MNPTRYTLQKPCLPAADGTTVARLWSSRPLSTHTKRANGSPNMGPGSVSETSVFGTPYSSPLLRMSWCDIVRSKSRFKIKVPFLAFCIDFWYSVCMLVGYARVSTQEQTLDLQLDALKKAGCERIFTDTISGAKQERRGLAEALEFMRAGDTIVVWRLDRLGRSLKHLIEVVTGLHERRVGFNSLTEQIDTTTSGGKLIFHVFGALAEFERDLVRERTQAGLQAARARGRQGGRPRRLDEKKIKLMQALYADKNNSVEDILSTLKISKSTLYRYVKRMGP